ncbi:MAG: hypothetical protein ACXWJW_06155 [Xanthobacteraceae bacterium]
MNQTVLNSGQFRGAAAVNVAAAVPYLDASSKTATASAPRRPFWPVAVLAVGGLLTLAWDGFLLWQFARVVILWLGSNS